MNTQRTSSKLMRESARAIATELVREPVKQAVREAIREEVATVSETSSAADESATKQRQEQSSKADQEQGGGRSKGALLAGLAAIVGIAYLARRRMSSTTGSAWTEPSSDVEADEEGGYVSEGEMQTAETSGDTAGSGTSPSTATDQ